MKLRYDELLSNVAFNFNLRRYKTALVDPHVLRLASCFRDNNELVRRQGRAVQVEPMKPKLKPPETKRLKLKCDILVLLSTSAFKFNVRHYTKRCHCWPRCFNVITSR